MLKPATAPSTTLARLVRDARYEVLPSASIEDELCQHLAPGRTITVTASPTKGLEPTLGLTERLARLGYDVVPHLAARMVAGRGDLAEIAARLAECGVRTVFVPAGDATDPTGGYAGAIDLLKDMAILGNPFSGVGITGYPESHPTIDDDLTIQAMWDKRNYATQVVSNMTFDADQLGGWVRRIRARGVGVPVLLGVPGPVERGKLLAMATKIGVGESTRFLAKNRRVFSQIAGPRGYDPLRFLKQLDPLLSDIAAGVQGLHVFTFNQVAVTERWRTKVLDTSDDTRLPAPAAVRSH